MIDTRTRLIRTGLLGMEILISSSGFRLVHLPAQVAALHLVHEQSIADLQGFGRPSTIPTILFKGFQNNGGFNLPGRLADSIAKRRARCRIHSFSGCSREAGHFSKLLSDPPLKG